MHLFQLYAGGGEHWPRFIPVGKSNPAHRAGAPTARRRWVAPARWVSASATAVGPPTTQGHFHCPWVVGECVRHCSRSTHHSGPLPLPLSGGWTSGSWIFKLILSFIPQLLIFTHILPGNRQYVALHSPVKEFDESMSGIYFVTVLVLVFKILSPLRFPIKMKPDWEDAVLLEGQFTAAIKSTVKTWPLVHTIMWCEHTPTG